MRHKISKKCFVTGIALLMIIVVFTGSMGNVSAFGIGMTAGPLNFGEVPRGGTKTLTYGLINPNDISIYVIGSIGGDWASMVTIYPEEGVIQPHTTQTIWVTVDMPVNIEAGITFEGSVLYLAEPYQNYLSDGGISFYLGALKYGSVISGEEINNQAPIANAGGPYSAPEGTLVTFDASNSYDPDNDELQYRWDFENDGIWDTSYSTNPTITNTWNDDYTGEVVVDVFDGVFSDIDTTSVIISNVEPTADAGSDKFGDEPSTFIFTGSHIDPGTSDTHTYEWDLDYDGITFNVDAIGNGVSQTWYDDFGGTVALRVTDDDGGWDIDTCSVVVNNVAPIASIDSIIQPYPGFILPNDELEFYGSYTDSGILDTHTIEWNFDDTTIVIGTLTLTHAYTTPGVYTITLTVTDDNDDIGTTSVVITIESPSEASEDTIEDIEEMDLPQGIENSLIAKLENAIDSMEMGNDNTAVNKLDAFINQVEAQRGKKLTDEEADALIEGAQWIIDNIENN